MSKIGLYDNTNNDYSLIAPANPSLSDYNTGEALIYSPGDTVTGTLTNMDSSNGYRYNSGDSFFRGDGVNDEVLLSGDGFTMPTSGTRTFRIRFKLNSTGIQAFSGYYNLGTNEQYWFGLWSDNRLNIFWGDSTTSDRWTGTTVLTTGVVYDAVFVRNGSSQKIYLNGVEESLTFTGTMPLTSATYGDASIFNRRNAPVYSSSDIYEIHSYSDAKDLTFIKDQWLSSQNQWQNDLLGTDNGDGTLSLSAEYTYIDSEHCWLDYDNFTVNANAWNTGRIGEWKRQPGLGYVDEVLARWDMSSYSGQTLNGVRLLTYTTTQGSQTGSATSTVYEQDKKTASNWANGVPGPPRFDDFDVSTAWATSLDTLSMQDGNQVYEHTDASMNICSLAQDWIDSVKDDDDGLIIDLDFGALSWYLDVFNVKLGIKFADGGVPIFESIYRRRRIQ